MRLFKWIKGVSDCYSSLDPTTYLSLTKSSTLEMPLNIAWQYTSSALKVGGINVLNTVIFPQLVTRTKTLVLGVPTTYSREIIFRMGKTGTTSRSGLFYYNITATFLTCENRIYFSYPASTATEPTVTWKVKVNGSTVNMVLSDYYTPTLYNTYNSVILLFNVAKISDTITGVVPSLIWDGVTCLVNATTLLSEELNMTPGYQPTLSMDAKYTAAEANTKIIPYMDVAGVG